MAAVIHRTTLEYRTTVHTPDFPALDWIINPDLTSVQAVPKKYWKIVGNSVVEMTQPEKDVVDAAILADQKKPTTMIKYYKDAAAVQISSSDPVDVTNGGIVVDGPGSYLIQFSGKVAMPNARINISLYKNGMPTWETDIRVAEDSPLAFNYIGECDGTDTFQVYLQRLTGAASYTLTQTTFIVTKG